jgi:regulator of protease activity HflC (stomatin/prohibitin superfamily)
MKNWRGWRRWWGVGGMLVAAVVASRCTSVAPDAGQEAVLVRKPILFGHGGVDPTPVKTGRSFVAWTTQAIYVPVVPQQFTVHFEDLMSSDGVPLDFDAIIRLRTKDSVRLMAEFGVDWYKSNIEAEFKNRVRQAVRKHGMNETAISSAAIDQIDDEVSKAMAVYVEKAHLPVELMDVTVGKANPPDSIKHQRVETAAQEQRVNTEKQRTMAENARLAAERARAEADNAYREAMKLSPEQFLQLETIKMQQVACAKGPCTFIVGSAATPVLNVR